MAAHHVNMGLARYSLELTKALAIAFLMRSYGCTINDVFDYELDQHVERCKTRPLASGRISYVNACMFAAAQILICVGVFYISLDTMGSASMVVVTGSHTLTALQQILCGHRSAPASVRTSTYQSMSAHPNVMYRTSCYPLMKRVTYWPQAWLGVAINFGAPIMWLSVTGDFDYGLISALLTSLWAWTILYGG
jgi:4-hydroxybenzoate polyprenyltransferase